MTDPGSTNGTGKMPRGRPFTPGKSGNPSGRPKGAIGLGAELRAELDEKVTVTENGKVIRISKRRLMIKALAAKAAKGNVAAADKLLSLVIQAEGFEDQRTAPKTMTTNDLQILEQFLGVGQEDDLAEVGDDIQGQNEEGVS